MNLPPLSQAFVLHFGEMGSRWGINRTVGQLYALLFVADRALNADEIVEKLGLSPLYQWVYDTAAKDSFVSIEKAERVLGYAPRWSNKDALVRNFEWYLANRERFSGQAGVTHRVPWRQGALAVAKRVF